MVATAFCALSRVGNPGYWHQAQAAAASLRYGDARMPAADVPAPADLENPLSFGYGRGWIPGTSGDGIEEDELPSWSAFQVDFEPLKSISDGHVEDPSSHADRFARCGEIAGDSTEVLSRELSCHAKLPVSSDFEGDADKAAHTTYEIEKKLVGKIFWFAWYGDLIPLWRLSRPRCRSGP